MGYLCATVIAPIDQYDTYWEDMGDGFDREYSPQNACVMEIPMQASVNEYGAAIITVPLDMPDVGAGMKPNLSLMYNSTEAERMFGNDWQLSGLSEIRRTAKSIYYDNIMLPVDKHQELDGNEAFNLDGRRLIVEQNNFPSSVSYRSETGNIKAKAFFRASEDNASGYVYSHFKVYYPNGKTAVFGFEEAEKNKDALHFPISRLTDLLMNTIHYEYVFSFGAYRISRITFGKNQEASVRFFYGKTKVCFRKGERYKTNRLSGETEYVENDSLFVTTDCALQRIEITHNDDIFRNYPLVYRSNGQYLFLSEIHMSRPKPTDSTQPTEPSDGTESDTLQLADLPTDGDGPLVLQNDTADFVMPLRFRYGSNQPRPTFDQTTETWAVGYTDFHAKKGLFGPSETTGIVVYPKSDPYNGSPCNETDSILIRPDLDHPKTYSIPAGKGLADVLCVNLNDTAGYEIVRVNNYRSGAHDVLDFSVYTFDAQGVLKLSYNKTFGTYFPTGSTSDFLVEKEFFTGNFTGNGDMEILAISSLTDNRFEPFAEIYVLKEERSFYDEYGFEVFIYSHTAYTGNIFSDINVRIQKYPGPFKLGTIKTYIVPGDFDGDGQTELFYRPQTNRYAALMKYDTDTSAWMKMGADTDMNEPDNFLHDYPTGDFNGDGRSDLYAERSVFLLSNGKETVRQQWADLVGGQAFSTEDMNGDGQGDLTILYGNGGETYFFAAGDMIAKASVPMGLPAGRVLASDNGVSADVGKGELVIVGNNELVRLSYGVDLSKDLLITGVKSSLGATTEFSYKKLDEGVYDLTSEAEYPYENLSPHSVVVSGVRKHFKGEVLEVKNYRYENGVYHKQGLGFCGFEKVTVTDSVRNQSTVSTFDPTHFGVLTKTDSPTQSTVYTYDIRINDDKTAKADLKSTVQTDKLKGTSVNLFYQHDNYGQPVQETVRFDEGVMRITDYRYRNVDTDTLYLLGELSSKTDYQYKNNVYASNSISFTYNGKGLVENKKTYYNGQLQSEEITPYSAEGLQLSTGIRRYSSTQTHTTVYQYDAAGRLIQETGPTGLTTHHVYDDDGRLTGSTDIYGKETAYEYDAFDRTVKTTTPDGLVMETKYRWTNLPGDSAETTDGPEPPAEAQYAVFNTTYGVVTHDLKSPAGDIITLIVDSVINSCSVCYYDAWGREVRTAELRFDDSWLKQDKQYDSRGRLWKVSLPYKGDTPGGWNTYSYDIYDRPTRIAYASGKEDTWSYSGNRVTSTSEGMSTTRTYNAAGQLTEVSDGGGTIRYTYRPDGQPASVEANGAVTTFAYDEYGRQTSITDPSAGVVQYEYDEAGRVTTQTDADGNVTGFEYDEFDRPLRKFTSELSTDYYYNAYGQPDSIVSDNGTGRSFTYDAIGRTIKERENAPDGKWLEKSMSYDASTGQLTAVTYSVQGEEIGMEKYMHQNGCLTQIKMSRSLRIPVIVGDAGWPVDWEIPPATWPDSLKGPAKSPANIILPTDDPISTTTIWELKAENDLGQPTQVTTGNLTRTYEYDDYGMPTRREVRDTTSQMIFGQAYDFDAATGNLLSRTDLVQQATDHFTYDPLNRLASHTPAHGRTLTFSYADNGNSTERGGDYRLLYEDAAHPYWQTGLETAHAETPVPDELFISSGANGLVKNISSHRQFLAGFTYDTDGRRVKMTLTHLYGGDLAEKYYLGGRYELDTHGEELLYLGGDAYSAPAVYRKEEDGSWKIHYICRDYLGSVCAITDADGQPVAAYSYDAWGNLRDPKTHELLTDQSVLFDRGYTGHEHMPSFGLINMNARLYDPLTGRFLAPDPYVQNPEHTQSYNRYAYALNNPLKYTDPSGERYTYDWDTGLYIDNLWGNLATWNQVYEWLMQNDQLIYLRGNISSGSGGGSPASGGNFGSCGWGGPGPGYSGGRGAGTNHASRNAWGLHPYDFYESGKVYYNLETRQRRYLSPHGWEVGTTLVTESFDGANFSDFYAWLGRTNTVLGFGGYAYSGLEHITANKNRWLGKNGKYYSRNWGGNQWAGSRAGALKAAKMYKVAGNITGILGAGVTIYQLRIGAISGVEAGFDLAFSAIGMTGWGAPLSLVYFGGKFLYETISGEYLFNKPY